MANKPIGKITHFFPKINVAVVRLNGNLKVGDKILIKGQDKEFEQTVKSMQVEHKNIEKAKSGQEVGMQVNEPVRENYQVFLVQE